MVAGLAQFYPELQSQAVFLNIDESERCRLAVEFPSLTEEQQNDLQKHFKGQFVNLRKSLFLLSAQNSALVSQVRHEFNT